MLIRNLGEDYDDTSTENMNSVLFNFWKGRSEYRRKHLYVNESLRGVGNQEILCSYWRH